MSAGREAGGGHQVWRNKHEYDTLNYSSLTLSFTMTRKP